MNWRTGKPFLYFLFTLLMEHSALIGEGTVVPNNPSASELYPCLLTAGIANRLPLGQPQLPARSIETIRNWILAGVPDWAVPSSPSNRFIHLTVIQTHLPPLTVNLPATLPCPTSITLAKELMFCISFDSPQKHNSNKRFSVGRG